MSTAVVVVSAPAEAVDVTPGEPTQVVLVTEEAGIVAVQAPSEGSVDTASETVIETVVEVGITGPQGPPSDVPGPQGPPGPPAEGTFVYLHVQAIPSDVWTIAHNLGGYPSVTVVDSAGTQVEGDVTYIDTNTVVVAFATAFSGTAHLS